MTVGNQPRDDIDESVDWAAMTSVFNLRNVFELVNYALNDGTLA